MSRSAFLSSVALDGPRLTSRPVAATTNPERWIGFALGPIALAALLLGWFTR